MYVRLYSGRETYRQWKMEDGRVEDGRWKTGGTCAFFLISSYVCAQRHVQRVRVNCVP